MSAVAAEGGTNPGGAESPGPRGEVSAPVQRGLAPAATGRESAGALALRVLLGVGALLLLGTCAVALLPTDWGNPSDRFADAGIEPEFLGKRFSWRWLRWISGQVVLGCWSALATGLVWLAFGQGRLAGVTQDETQWLDLSRPCPPGWQRVPVKSRNSDWLGMLWRALGLLCAGPLGLLQWLEFSDFTGLLLPWLAVMLWLLQDFARILWRRVTETPVLTSDRLVWHLGPCQVQIPFARLEEVLRCTSAISPEFDRLDLQLITRGRMTLVARPGLPLWLCYWLLPRRELVVQSGLTHECFRLRPANELVALEALAAHAPHLIARGTGLLAMRPREKPGAATEELARNPTHSALVQQSERRVLLLPQLHRSVLLNLVTWVLLPFLVILLQADLQSVYWSRSYLGDWCEAPFLTLFLVWFAFLRYWLGLSRKALPQCEWNAWPTSPSRTQGFRQAPGRWGWLEHGGHVWCLLVLGLLLVLVGKLRMALDLPELAMFEGLGVGLWLTLALRLLRRIWVSWRGMLWLLPDRFLGDCGWTQIALMYDAMQEATWTAPLGSATDAGQLRLRGAVPFQIPARRSWWNLPWMPFLNDREIPPAWRDRVWLVTLAEPERFLNELGPHVPHLTRCATGWITPLPAMGTTGLPAGEPSAQSTTNSTSRQ